MNSARDSEASESRVGGKGPIDAKATGAAIAAAGSAVLLVLSVPVATWWLVGDLSTRHGREAYYAFHPPDLTDAQARAAGIVALVVTGGSAGVLLWSTWTRRVDRRWWSVVLPLVALGAFAGWGYRGATAGVSGVNFGAGFVLLAAPPIVMTLLGVSAYKARRIRRDRQGRHAADMTRTRQGG